MTASDDDRRLDQSMKSRLIVNPVAGSDEGAEHLPVINARLRTMVDHLDIVMTTGEGDATRAASQAVAEGYGTIFVAGGDGTLNQALNGVASVPGGLARTIIGVIPIGTGNDFARALGFADDIEDTLDLLASSTPAAIDVGVVNGHHFLNVSAGGFIAEVSDAVDARMKSVAGLHCLPHRRRPGSRQSRTCGNHGQLGCGWDDEYRASQSEYLCGVQLATDRRRSADRAVRGGR